MKSIFTRYNNPIRKSNAMKIAIYGDSFATPNANKSDSLAWTGHLCNDFDITNYARGGSNLAYTYDLFLKHNMNYDVNLVFITSYGRLWLPNLETVDCGIPGLAAAEHNLNICTHEGDLQILRAAKDYYLYVEYEPHVKLMHKAVIKDLQRHNNTILIPCFDSNTSLVDGFDNYMYQLSQIDYQYYSCPAPINDKRNCHMNDANNLIFANKMKEYLLGDMTKPFTIDLSDYVEPIGEPYEKYFFTEEQK